MKQEVLITVRSTFRTEGETEHTEFFTTGSLYLKNGKYYLLYELFEEGQPPCKTSVIVEGQHRLVLRNAGENDYSFVLDQGVRCQSWFQFAGGRMMLGINPVEIESALTLRGGKIRMRYGLEASGVLLTENEIEIDVKVK